MPDRWPLAKRYRHVTARQKLAGATVRGKYGCVRMGIVCAVHHRRRFSLDANPQPDYGLRIMDMKSTIVIVLIVAIAYIAGARYPQLAQKLHAA